MHINYLKSGELAVRWKMSHSTLRHWRIMGKGPPFHKMEGKILYDLQEIEEYEQNKKRHHTSEQESLQLRMA